MGKKLTPWFPGNVKPARPGVYNASVAWSDDVWRYWDGEAWSYHWCTGDEYEHESRATRSDGQNIPWRGLAQEPKP